MRPAALLALVVALTALCGGAYLQGRSDGRAGLVAELAAVDADRREAIAKLEAARLAALADRDRLAQELEDAARESPVTNPVALPVDRVRRLARLR